MAANHIIVSRLHTEFPEDGILSEESIDTDRRLTRRRVWMIDPLDGTNGFIDRNGDFAVQIGLTEGGHTVLGVVYQPAIDTLYFAVKGSGSWVRRKQGTIERVSVSGVSEIHSMRLAASRNHRSPKMDRVIQSLGFKDEVRRGSVGIKIGLIVERECDLYIHLSPKVKEWDTCAPGIVLTEAGGTLTDLFGEPLKYNLTDVQHRNGVVATNGRVHKQIIDKLSPLLAEFGRVRVNN
jgi:3'(2'), 5'-bisphosphate nucleotidase